MSDTAQIPFSIPDAFAFDSECWEFGLFILGDLQRGGRWHSCTSVPLAEARRAVHAYGRSVRRSPSWVILSRVARDHQLSDAGILTVVAALACWWGIERRTCHTELAVALIGFNPPALARFTRTLLEGSLSDLVEVGPRYLWPTGTLLRYCDPGPIEDHEQRALRRHLKRIPEPPPRS